MIFRATRANSRSLFECNHVASQKGAMDGCLRRVRSTDALSWLRQVVRKNAIVHKVYVASVRHCVMVIGVWHERLYAVYLGLEQAANIA